MAGDHSTYYHYTDEESAFKILQSGHIKQSDPKVGDAVFGRGTYLTKLGPSKASPAKVAENNYDGMKKTFWESKIHEGKTNVAIAVKLPKVAVKHCSAGDRDVHLYEGDLNLSEANQVDVYMRDEDGLKKYSHH